jgi:hypothetical protein
MTTQPTAGKQLSRKYGSLNISKTYGPPWPITGLAWTFYYLWSIYQIICAFPVSCQPDCSYGEPMWEKHQNWVSWLDFFKYATRADSIYFLYVPLLSISKIRASFRPSLWLSKAHWANFEFSRTPCLRLCLTRPEYNLQRRYTVFRALSETILDTTLS